MKIGKLKIEIKITREDNFMNEVKYELSKGHKLKAIKIYKDATGKHLRESKEFIDTLCPKYYKPYNNE